VEQIFYDGSCGLCHWAVKFVLPRDRKGVFRFAPLDSERFREAVHEADRQALPDSVVVLTADGRMLTRSAGVLHILDRLGGGWALLGTIGRLVPRPVRDWLYDAIARIRYRLFARPPEVCPILPPEYRARFDA
jgi:predicted DCC family thiol-disulfide oxidoreductase YuxK